MRNRLIPLCPDLKNKDFENLYILGGCCYLLADLASDADLRKELQGASISKVLSRLKDVSRDN